MRIEDVISVGNGTHQVLRAVSDACKSLLLAANPDDGRQEGAAERLYQEKSSHYEENLLFLWQEILREKMGLFVEKER